MADTQPVKNLAGAGFTFEDRVGASLAATMLAGSTPLDPELGSVVRIDFQVAADGWRLDDLLLTFSTARSCASVKSFVQVDGTRVSSDFVARAWEDLFSAAFDRSKDLVTMVTASLAADVRHDLQELIRLARAQDADDLDRRVAVAGYLSESRRRLWESCRLPDTLGELAIAGVSGSPGELLSRLRVLEFDFEYSPSIAEQRALELCALALREPAEAASLWEALLRIVSTVRPAGGALTRTELVSKLRGRFDLYDDSEDDVRSRVLAAHRARERRRGSTLQLFAVPPALQDLPRADADARILVQIGDDDRIGDKLDPVLRRFGRVLLIGAPGGGKSTAVRSIAAHWAQSRDWPVPVFVELRRLAKRGGDLTQAILDMACESAPLSEREALRVGLEHELDAGRCALLLDGLDELRAGRIKFVQHLNEWQQRLPDGTEILVTVRPTVAPEATLLGFRELRLRSPDDPDGTVDAILIAAAPDLERDTWIEERRKWVSDAFRRDLALKLSPLTVVTLTVTAALAKSPTELPQTRAHLLKKALHDVVDRWEIAQRASGEVKLGSLDDSVAVEAVHFSLRLLCEMALASDAPTEVAVRARLARGLVEEFGLAPGLGRAAAEDAVDFWIETGLFAFDDAGLVARNRPLAEVGLAARHEHDDDHAARTFVTTIRHNPDHWPVLALAAGLSAEVAHEWSRGLAEDGTPDELIEFVEAVRDGALTTVDDLASVVRSRIAAWLDSDADAERVVEAAIELPLDASTRIDLRAPMLSAVPADRRMVIEALMITAWDDRSEEADDLLRRFVAQPWPAPSREEAPRSAFEIIVDEVDETYRCAHEAACLRLAEGTHADAELAAACAQNSSLDYHFELRRRLSAGGHHDLVAKVKEAWPSTPGFSAFIGDGQFERATDEYLRVLTVPAPGKTLSQSQRRRMDELADCFATAELNWINPNLVIREPDVVSGWIQAIAQLAAFDLGVLAAQAELLGTELATGIEGHGFPYKKGTPRDPVNWTQVVDVEQTRAALLAALGRLGRHSDHQLTLALISAPDPHLAATRLRHILPQVRLGDTLRFAWMLLAATEKTEADNLANEWVNSDDPMLRAAAARWWSYRAVQTRRLLPQFDKCLFDEDENVREAALSFLNPDDVAVFRPRLSDLAAATAVGWQCSNCGASNDRGFACSTCSVGRPDVAGKLRELLGEEKRSQQPTFRRRPTLRRLSRPREI